MSRKAWLFADTPAGAHASALIYSLVEAAKANGAGTLHVVASRMAPVANGA